MNYRISYDHERDLIYGSVEGDLDPALVKAMAAEFASIVASTGCRKLLNDLRNARITHSPLDIHSMPRIIDTQGVSLVCRRALLISEPSEDFEFLETVSLNFGQQVRLFYNLEAALEWLKGDTPPPHQPNAEETAG
ncbi:MAG: hypothetical protein K8T26_02520 [Lentisphaerae bacterium]|nr:hypothetical protein [Lentisphaerota bacterium]